MGDEWSGLADLLANMIEKYAGDLDIDNLPDPETVNCSQKFNTLKCGIDAEKIEKKRAA